MTYNVYKESSVRGPMGSGFIANPGPKVGTSLEKDHLNHLHVSYVW